MGAPHEALHLSWTLPDLPSGEWREAIDIVTNLLDVLEPQFPGSCQFAAYSRQNWRDKCELIPAENPPLKTTFLLQTTLAEIRDMFPSNRNFWMSLEHLHSEMSSIREKWTRVEQGGRLNTVGYGRLRRDEKHVKNVLGEFLPMGRLTLRELMSRIMDNPRREQLEKCYLRPNVEHLERMHWDVSNASAASFQAEPGNILSLLSLFR